MGLAEINNDRSFSAPERNVLVTGEKSRKPAAILAGNHPHPRLWLDPACLQFLHSSALLATDPPIRRGRSIRRQMRGRRVFPDLELGLQQAPPFARPAFSQSVGLRPGILAG